jgi:hypothetical protein
VAILKPLYEKREGVFNMVMDHIKTATSLDMGSNIIIKVVVPVGTTVVCTGTQPLFEVLHTMDLIFNKTTFQVARSFHGENTTTKKNIVSLQSQIRIPRKSNIIINHRRKNNATIHTGHHSIIIETMKSCKCMHLRDQNNHSVCVALIIHVHIHIGRG